MIVKISALSFSVAIAISMAQTSLPPLPGPHGSVGPQQGYFQLDSTAGPLVFIDAQIEPPLSNPDELKLSWRVFRAIDGKKQVWHRFVIDEVHKQYFGYDLTLNAVASGPLAIPLMAGSYRMVFSPLTTQPQQPGESGLTAAPLPRYPEPQTVTAGDKVAVDLLVSADGKRKVVDYIQIAPFGTVDPPASSSTAVPKDYTIDDGPVRFDFRGYVAINGQKFQGLTSFSKGKNGGATLWFCFPGQQGRYILSLEPSPMLTKIGMVRDNVVLFSPGTQRYEIRMQNPVVGHGAWNLYGLYDPSHGASEDSAEMPLPPLPAGAVAVLGGTDRLENLLPK